MDVFLDGKNACRLTDKQFHNHYNTVNMQGNLDPPVISLWSKIDAVIAICYYISRLLGGTPNKRTNRKNKERNLYQNCLDGLLKDYEQMQKEIGFPSKILGETRYTRDRRR